MSTKKEQLLSKEQDAAAIVAKKREELYALVDAGANSGCLLLISDFPMELLRELLACKRVSRKMEFNVNWRIENALETAERALAAAHKQVGLTK